MSGAALWRWDELRAALAADGPETGPDVTGVSLDSRSLAPGDLFFALSGGPDPRYRGAAGSGRDGHDFVVAAAAAGAPAAVVSRPTGAALAELRVDEVDVVLEILVLLPLPLAACRATRGPRSSSSA